MSDVIKNRYEFVVLFDVENGNPNGDPDAGNMPRIDPESGLGLVTDVCLKRKIRNYIETVKEDAEGYKIYIKEDVPLNRSDREACEALGVMDTEDKKLTESLKKLKKGVLYDRKDAKESYRHGLYDETVHWLTEDLKYVPKDKIIMICAHAQMFNKKTTMVRRNKNFAAYSKALLDFKYVYSWAGHNHHTYLYTSEPERNYNIDNLTSITVTKSTGALRLNRLLNNDGTPQGYFVVDVDGEEVSWYYLCCGKDRNDQMKVYPPMRTGGEYVMANIWAHDNKWGAVEWWENGVKVGEMEAHDALDPDYVDLYATVTNKTTRKYCKPINSFHMFRIKPSEGVREGEVRVTDRFGNLHTKKVSW